MNKRELSKIARPVATEEMVRLAERIDKDKYIATAKIIDVSGEKILLLNFFERLRLIEKKTEAEFRTFISRDDYITQDLTTARVKWKTGCLCHLIGWWWWDTDSRGHDVIFASDQDYISARYYMKKCIKKDNQSVWEAIKSYQFDVMDKRLKARHKKETDKIDKKMERVPPKPEGFEKWAHNIAMGDKRYLIYKAAGKKSNTTGYCTSCKKEMKIDVKAIHPRNKKRGICPKCGKPITFIPKGYFPSYQRDEKWICLLQKISGGIVARYFHAFQTITRDENYKEDFYVGELCRVFYEGKTPKIDSYEWDVYKQRGLPRWCPDHDKFRCASAVLYTDNLPADLMDSVYQYSALKQYQEMKGSEPIPIWRYMRDYPENKFLEMFVKAGLTNLVDTIVTQYNYELNPDGKTPMDILKLPKDYIPILREINGTIGELLLLRQCAADKVFPKSGTIREFYKRFGGNDEMMGAVNGHMNIRKFIRYMDKQRSILPKQSDQPCCHMGMMSHRHYTKEERIQQEYKDLGKDWLDYISWCTVLKYDMKDMYVILPPDFKKAHDRVMKEYEKYKDKQQRKRLIEIERMIKKVLSETEDSAAISLKTKKLMIVVPKSGEEIKYEGRTLHHCVGTYVERVARGETMILFVRKVDNPEEPYFTLEYANGRVVQCRGKNNCAMTKEVKAFAMAFERKMKLAENKKVKAKAG